MDINFLRKGNIEEDDNFGYPAATLAAQSFSIEKLPLFKYIRILVYILVFLVPLFFIPWTSDILDFDKQFLVFSLSGIGLILYVAQVIKTGHLVLKKSLANYGALVFLAAAVLVALFSDFKYLSIFGGFGAGFQGSLVSTAAFAVFFFLVLNAFNGPEDLTGHDFKKLLDVFGLSSFLVLVLGVLQIFKVPVFNLFGVTAQAFNTVGTMNSLGIIAALLLVISLTKKPDKERKTLFDYVRLPALFLSLFLLLILNWWVLWLIVISGLVFVLVSKSLSDWRILNYFWPLTIILLAVVFMLLKFNLASSFGISLPIEVAPSFSASFDIAKQAFVKDPLFGVGQENFSLAYDLYRPASINNTVFWNIRFPEATSELFNFLITSGIVGLAGLLFLVWTGFKLGLKNYDLLPLFAVLVATLILYPFNISLGFSFWFILGLLALAASRREDKLVVNLEKSPRHSLITSVSFVGVLVLAVIGFYFMTLRYTANIKFTRAMNATDIDRQTQIAVEAINLDRNDDMYSRALTNLLISRVSQELQNLGNAKTDSEKQAVITKIQNFSATAIDLGNETTQRHPKDSANWFSQALVYENLINIIDGSDQWAVKMYQEYSSLSPQDPVPYLRTGNIHLVRADFLRQLIFGQGAQIKPEDRTNMESQIIDNLKRAQESFRKAIELKSDYVLAIYNLGVVYDRQGRVKDAIKQLELTRSANPLDANVIFQLSLLYYRDNQKDKSFNELQRTTTIFPDFSNARWYLALLYEERGELDKALSELRKIEELNPDNEILKDKISQLERGKRSIPPEKVTGVKPLEEKSENQ